MGDYKLKIAETLIVLLLFVISKLVSKRIIRDVGMRFKYHSRRIKVTNKIVGVINLTILIVILMLIWGVEQSEVLLFLSTILTILGVALFAQWSIISNITSTLIIFFSHPIKIGDNLTIMDKDYPIEGRLSDIGFFFIIIVTKDNMKITIPSNVFMQKMIRKDNTV